MLCFSAGANHLLHAASGRGRGMSISTVCVCATRKLERFPRAYYGRVGKILSVVSDDLENPCTAMDALEVFNIAKACEFRIRASLCPCTALPSIVARL